MHCTLRLSFVVSFSAEVIAMHEHDGVWVANLEEKWVGKYYLLDDTVYAPSTRTVVENVVSDPYSVDLALNGSKSRITDVDAETNATTWRLRNRTRTVCGTCVRWLTPG